MPQWAFLEVDEIKLGHSGLDSERPQRSSGPQSLLLDYRGGYLFGVIGAITGSESAG